MYKYFFVFAAAFALVFDAWSMTTFTVTRTGRKVQLDGFLLEWPKNDMKKMSPNWPWAWDAMNTAEGLTGYFKAPSSVGEDWTFSFLPQRLSPYSRMTLSFSTDSGQSFYRVSKPASNPDSSMAAEWVIPWSRIAVDTPGDYEVGIMAYNGRGDTLPAMVLSGKAPRLSAASPWGKVYYKAIFLVALLFALFYVQKKAKKKTKSGKKKEES
jgi:hypothetical protein